jgi:class 3 adenylate cyclase/YHS domain-containing protein
MDSEADPTIAAGHSVATIAFIDLAGFSAIADVFGDAAAIGVLDLFEELVSASVGGDGRLVKWIGDEAMLLFPDPDRALQALSRLLPACRAEERIPLTRCGLNHGPVIRRGSDVFGSTVNIASRITAFATAGQLVATQPVANVAREKGISVQELGPIQLRSIAQKIPLFVLQLAEAVEPAWIDPVCKMHAPYSAYRKTQRTGHWFCSPRCEEAYRRSPETYAS